VFAFERFIEIESWKGIFNSLFFFPQYFINAIFAGAIAVAFIMVSTHIVAEIFKKHVKEKILHEYTMFLRLNMHEHATH